MIRHEFQQELLRRASGPGTILWLGMIGTPFILGFVLWRSSGQWQGPSAFPKILPPVLYGISLILVLIHLTVRSRLLNPDALVARAGNPETVASVLPSNQPQSPEEVRALAVTSTFLSTYLITWAIADAVSAMGFVLGIITREVYGAYALLLAGGVLVLIARPSQALLTETIRRAETLAGVE